jgi:uncharacterized phage protein gp47/JayE
MADFPSRLDLFALGRDYVLSRATRIDPAQVDVAGSDVNIIVASASHMSMALVYQLAQRINALLLDGATGDDLDRYALDRYQLTRKAASTALGTVTFFRADASGGAGSVPISIKLGTLTGVEYITTSVATFGATDLTADATVRAVTAGKDSQVGANAIRRINSPTPLFDTTLQVTNANPAAGGEDAEDDDTFRERIRDFFITARRGTLAAIEFGAKTVPGVVSAQAIEALTHDAQPARIVSLYIADSSGVASSALAAAVRTALNDYRAGGIAVIVNASLPQIVTVQLKLTFKAGVDTTTLTDNVRAAMVEFINGLAVNTPLLRAQMFTVLQRYADDGLIPNENSIASPTGDLFPDIGKTLRTTLTDVTVA